MTFEFDYDFIRDFQSPKLWVKLSNAFGGIALLVYGAIQILNFISDRNLLLLVIGIIILMGGFSYLLFAINGNRPILKQGQYFLRIANRKLHAKLGKFASYVEVNFNELKKINITNKEVKLVLLNGTEIWIELNKIQNKNKQKVFVKIMNEWNSFL